MKLSQARDNYTYFSGRASEIARQLAFAGIALIWIFKSQVGEDYRVPRALLPAAALIVLALILDFAHYGIASLCWGIFSRVKEREGVKEDAEFLAPRQINWPSILFFWTKLIAIIVAYIYILHFLIVRIHAS
ncbi:MAG TPA: hypothetical protein VMU45_07290 [Candidatus Eisenbacteria bacterium]|nr:hypothetical protein [Candidatus Eisenbacteria bacterium]